MTLKKRSQKRKVPRLVKMKAVPKMKARPAKKVEVRNHKTVKMMRLLREKMKMMKTRKVHTRQWKVEMSQFMTCQRRIINLKNSLFLRNSYRKAFLMMKKMMTQKY